MAGEFIGDPWPSFFPHTDRNASCSFHWPSSVHASRADEPRIPGPVSALRRFFRFSAKQGGNRNHERVNFLDYPLSFFVGKILAVDVHAKAVQDREGIGVSPPPRDSARLRHALALVVLRERDRGLTGE